MQPLQEARTAALRCTAAASRLAALGSLAASRSRSARRKPLGAAALFAAGMAAAASLQPLKKARTAALRAQQPHAGSQHAGAAQQAGAGAHGAQAAGAVQQPGPQSPARETEVVAITLKATRATANKRKRRFMGDTPCDKRPNGKFTQTSVNRGLGSDLAMLSTKKRAAT